MLDRSLSVAPMMDWTDRHDRYFLRLISPHALLYTEMITTGALLHGDTQYLLNFHPAEHPVALQLGGSEPHELAACARLAYEAGYDEINLNIGCPSPRVQKGAFGVCLMKEPMLVRDCVSAMQSCVPIPVTVKTRIGVDECDDYAFVHEFIKTVSAAPCDTFIIHARKAWLKGLSPKENREIPPLRYDIVQELKKDFPQLNFILNGGLKTREDVMQYSQLFAGVMLGREAYKNPYFLALLEEDLFHTPLPTRISIVEKMFDYIDRELSQGTSLTHITRHMLGLFQACKGARMWRRVLTEKAREPAAGIHTLQHALTFVKE